MTTATIRIVLLSRSAHWTTLSAVAMCTLATVLGRYALELDLSSRFPPTKLVVVEQCAVLAATLHAILTRPRFWAWDRTATTNRPRAVAAATATAGILLPALCVLAVLPSLPDNTTWTWVLANVLLLSATVQLLSPLLTPLLAGTPTAIIWFAGGVVANLAPQVWQPLATHRDPAGEWTAVACAVAAAVAIHFATCGTTSWARHRFT